MQKRFVLVLTVCACMLPFEALASGSYSQLGGGSGHLGVASGGGPTDLSSPRLVAGPDLWWINQSSVVVADKKVIGLTLVEDTVGYHTGVVAVDDRLGTVLWTGAAPDLLWESWTTPAVDLVNRVVVVAQRNQVVGLDLADGHELWHITARTGKSFINASPAVDAGTAYISEFGGNAMLYAIDTATGQIRWQTIVGYISGANTVALTTTRAVIVTSDGWFRTLNRTTGALDVSVRISQNGFFGGVAAEETAAYTVDFTFGGGEATRIFKVNPATGAVIWSTPAPRTDTIPVITDTLVLVSGGDGYPQMGDDTDDPGFWAFDKATGQLLWQTPLAGGWTCQPVAAGNIAYVPVLGQTGPMSGALRAFDLTKTPSQPGFQVASTGQIACSVAVSDGNVYGTGPYGLVAFGPQPSMPGDFNGDGAIDVVDLLIFADSWSLTSTDEGFNPDCDFNHDGAIDIIDLLTFAEIWGQ